MLSPRHYDRGASRLSWEVCAAQFYEDVVPRLKLSPSRQMIASAHRIGDYPAAVVYRFVLACGAKLNGFAGGFVSW